MIEQIEKCSNVEELEACLRAEAARPPAGVFDTQRAWIQECFAATSVEKIVEALRTQPEPEAKQAAAEIEGKSPTALKVTLRALRNARTSDELKTCLREEYKIVMACLRHHDFAEGVRAAVINKDRSPKWNPSALAEVTTAQVDGFFVNNGFENLKLDSTRVETQVPRWQ